MNLSRIISIRYNANSIEWIIEIIRAKSSSSSFLFVMWSSQYTFRCCCCCICLIVISHIFPLPPQTMKITRHNLIDELYISLSTNPQIINLFCNLFALNHEVEDEITKRWGWRKKNLSKFLPLDVTSEMRWWWSSIFFCSFNSILDYEKSSIRAQLDLIIIGWMMIFMAIDFLIFDFALQQTSKELLMMEIPRNLFRIKKFHFINFWTWLDSLEMFSLSMIDRLSDIYNGATRSSSLEFEKPKQIYWRIVALPTIKSENQDLRHRQQHGRAANRQYHREAQQHGNWRGWERANPSS